MDILENLNPQQYQAVTVGSGAVLVLAGPGSGKTRVLTRRIAYLINALGVPPYRILAVTFTNKAARQMQERVTAMISEPLRSLEGIWLGTFHAMCARLLRREHERLPYRSNFVILDEGEQESVIKRALKELNLNDKLYRPSSVLAAISNAKNALLLPADYPRQNYRDEVVARVYERYSQILLNSNALDFDDLLLWAVKLLRENPDVQEKYARRFLHVLVDEFQDTNQAQYELLKLLSAAHGNLFVVGDEDQSIYRWRGADYRNVLRFEQDFPHAQKILLEQNYRSTQTVLDAARAVIDRNAHRTPKFLFSDRGRGERIVFYEAVDDYGEAAYVVDTIQQWLVSGRARGSDFAVMYRTNAQSRLLEEAFLRARLPYRLVGAQRFYGRREVKDVLAYLRLAQNPLDEVSLLRVINVPPRGIGDKTLVNLQLVAQHNGVSPGQVLLDLGRKGEESPYWEAFKGRSVLTLADFGALIAGWQELVAAGAPLPVLFDRILADVGYQRYVDDQSEEGLDRWENVQELRRLAYENQERTLAEFLEGIALVSDQDTLNESTDAPTLLTLHAAKGLEFSQVFITGLDEGLLPHSRSRDDPEAMAEERRLFYDGLTRAKDRLYLVRAAQRSSFGAPEYTEASRFLDDIPDELLKREGVRLGRAMPGTGLRGVWASALRWESAPQKSSPAVVPVTTFRPTQRVRHPTYGEGIVLESRIEDGEELVDVHFESVGFKRLVASMARLERVERQGNGMSGGAG